MVLVVVHLQLKDLQTNKKTNAHTRITEGQAEGRAALRATFVTRMQERREVVAVRLPPPFICTTAERVSNNLDPAPSVVPRNIHIYLVPLQVPF